MNRARAGLVVASLVAAAFVPPTTAAGAAETVQCSTSVPLHVRKPDTSLTLYQHDEPENGNPVWQTQVGHGFAWDGITLGGPDGVVYELAPDGTLSRFRWLGSGWESGGVSQTVRTGWTGWSRDTLVVDAKGDFYGISPADGNLHRYRYTLVDGTWTTVDHTVAVGWAARYDMLWASGEGVLFARTRAGALHQYTYHAESRRLLVDGLQAGDVGWNQFTDVASVGGGVFYALNGGTQQLKWYRYTGGGTWAPASGSVVGDGGWRSDWQIEGQSDACRVVGAAVPQRPAVPQRFDAPTTPVQGPDGRVTYFYVSSAGGLVAAKQRNPGDYTIIDYATLTGYHRYTGQPGAGVRADGRLEVLANSSDDAGLRGKVQQVGNGLWGADVAAHEGWMAGDPAIVTEASGALAVLAADGEGGLWQRRQVAAGGGYEAWRRIATGGVTTDFTVLRNGAALDVVARFTDGSVRVLRVVDGVPGTWRAVGAGATSRPAAVAHPNGDLQVFVRGADGHVLGQREGGGVFGGTWQQVGDLVVPGPPAAVVTGAGLVELAVRDDDGFVRQAGQLAPAAGFGDWVVRYFEETATDPTGLVLADGKPIFTWRTPGGLVATSYLSSGAANARGPAGATARR
ncbi:tachylectin-related carbohydrate-binding protein [Saccharothrix longispora]|uniref:tachylectin-related carbohydrate-binding protein n=1 Tax=Saccharothrix longispora TaxID=33920 RepID=UPI0028FD97F9|nr:tachylectin-related carbohydrate-binding protein [Saccharothrix longispora]MDU0288836.1 tachylectin-related carbohydrate-binding protein [Saccharothrix longispora]